MDSNSAVAHGIQQLIYQSKLEHLSGLALASNNLLTKAPENPPIKLFSQNDEDGIIARIFQRIGKNDPKVFLEFGVDEKMECNTLALLYGGWKGVWVDQSNHPIPARNPNLRIIKQWVSLDTIDSILNEAISTLGGLHVDFLSIDLDGNDIYVLQHILRRITAKVICLEYNGHFIPPARFSIKYNPDHHINGDHYGASLQSFADQLEETHALVATNLTGVNAFFVSKEFADYFPDARKTVLELYTPPRYYSAAFERIHPVSSETLKYILGYSNS